MGLDSSLAQNHSAIVVACLLIFCDSAGEGTGGTESCYNAAAMMQLSFHRMLAAIVILTMAALCLADAIPKAGPQALADRKIKQQFKDQYALKDNESRIALSKALRAAARELKEHPRGSEDVAVRYVMLREARELAVDGGDFHLAFAAVDQMAADFPVNPLELKLSALSSGLDKTNLPPLQLADAYLHAIDDWLDVGDVDSARRTMVLVHNCQRHAPNNPALSQRVIDYEKKMADARKDLRDVGVAAQKLRKQPDDPALNQTVGLYLCKVGRWNEGLTMLTKASDPALRALAAKDLANPTDMAAIMEVADAWWAGDDAKSLHLSQTRRRAVYWYQTALPQLPADKKAEVEKRIAETGQ